jgi:thioredoxin 1
MAGRHVASESFDREVLQSERPTLVDFHADWCGPCRAVAPVLDELANELEGKANVVTVNVDDSADLAQQYGVQALPTFIVFRGGKATTKLVGMQSKEALAKAVAA